MHNKNDLFQNQKAVSEIIGTMLLLGSAVVLFSVVYFSILSAPTPTQPPAFNVMARMEGQTDNATIVVSHMGGDPVDVNSRFFIEVAGERKPEQILKNYIIENNEDEDLWNFGEQISYPIGNVSGVQVDMGIADLHSNSLVLLSTLQEGFKLSSFGFGGIWHFDENTSNTAYDSSPNLNHGTITAGNWTMDAQNNSALSFDGLQSTVHIPSSFSLNIQESLTMEAWVKPEEHDEIISHELLTQKFAYTPDILHVGGDVFAIASEKQSKEGVLITINITNVGSIEETDNQWIFDESTASETLSPHIIHMKDDLYVISYVNKTKTKAFVKTVHIYQNATIKPTGYSLSFDTKCEDSTLTKINDEIFALVYTRDNPNENEGVIRILNMSNSQTGELIDTTNNLFFDTNNATVNPSLNHLFDNIYGLVYSHSLGKRHYSFLSTLRISSNGIISDFFDPIDLNSSGCRAPFLLALKNNLSLLFYDNSDDDGYVRSMYVNNDGSINPIFQEIKIRDSSFFMSHVIKISNSSALLAYSDDAGGNPSGYFQVISINSTDHPYVSKSEVEFDDRTCLNPEVFQISDVVFGIAYTSSVTGGGGQHIGSIKTIFIEPDPDDMYMRVMGKKGSYGFNVNTTTVFITINGELVTAPLNQFAEWYHVVVTCDQNDLIVYANNVSICAETFDDAPITIKKTNSPLLFGKGFYGIIDEVGLYGRVLSRDEISNHFEHPGSLG